MVCAGVGKEFPDVRHNERRIKFTRVGEAVKTAARLKGELTLSKTCSQFLQPQDRKLLKWWH